MEKALDIDLGEESRTMLMESYQHLPAFPDAAPGLASFKSRSNVLPLSPTAKAKVVREVLEHAQLLELFDDIISADEVRTFKP